MQQADTLNSFSLDKLAGETRKINREQKFTGFLFAAIAVAVLVLAGFFLVTDSGPKSPYEFVELLGIPLLFTYIAVLYFRAVKETGSPDWTLADRISTEKARVARIAVLYRKLPTHLLVPLGVILLLGILPDLFDGSSADSSLGKMLIFIGSVVFIFAASFWGLRRAEQHRLRPMVEKLDKLEKQLENG